MKQWMGWALVAVVLAWSAPAQAHGIWGHIHVTGWAMENLPEGELKDFFSDPEVFNAALFGAAFTDSGYWPQGGELAQASRRYSEHTHWEPFISDFVAWIIENDPPPWTSQESRTRVAFLMGCASHGLQDEIFDSVFLYQIQEHDGAGQDEADPGTDGFLALDFLIRFDPQEVIPMETLLELYAPLGPEITEDVIRRSVAPMTNFYVNHRVGIDVATGLGQQHEEQLAWTRRHYLDPAIPGSLRAEIMPTAHYLQAIWERLHGEFDGSRPVVAVYPEAPRRLLGPEAGSPDSWVTLIFGEGIQYDEIETYWRDSLGEQIPYSMRNTRWGEQWPRLVRLQPTESLVAGDWYTAGMAAGPERVGGGEVTAPFEIEFQVECGEDNPEDCEDLGELPTPEIGDPVMPEPDVVPEPEMVPEPEPQPDPEPMPEPEPEPEVSEPEMIPEPPTQPTSTRANEDGCAVAGTGTPSWPFVVLIGWVLLASRRRL